MVMGDGNRRIERVGLAFGALGSLEVMLWFLANGAQAIVAGEVNHWKTVRYLQDADVPLILTDHAASENPGLRKLADFIRDEFHLPTTFIETGSPFRLARE